MNKLKAIAKTAMGETLLRTGLWRRHLEKMARRKQALVLTYHRVIEKWDRTLDYSQPGMVVTADTFERQLTFLKKHFNIVPLSSLVNPKFEIRNSKPRCVITFDDGWRDNYEVAFPILRKHGVPATAFLTTDFIGTSRAFWHTELMYLLMHGDLSRLKLTQYVLDPYPTPVRRGLMRLAHMEQAPGADDVDALIEAVKATCDEPVSDQLIGELGNALCLRRPLFADRRFFLDWEQVREMIAGGLEVGSHGCSHRILTRLPIKEAEVEAKQSKELIEHETGRLVHFFAFPNNEWSESLCSLIKRVGYRGACVGDTKRTRGLDPFVFRRLSIHEGVTASPFKSSVGPAMTFLLARWMTRRLPKRRSGGSFESSSD